MKVTGRMFEVITLGVVSGLCARTAPWASGFLACAAWIEFLRAVEAVVKKRRSR